MKYLYLNFIKKIILVFAFSCLSCGVSESNVIDLDDKQIDYPLPLSDYIKVTTFNIGHFSNGKSYTPNGTYSNFDEYKKIFDTIDSDVIAINENSVFFDADSRINTTELYSSYPFYFCGESHYYNCNAIISKNDIIDSNEHIYSNSSDRYYIDSLIIVNKVQVHFIVTHLEWYDINTRHSQIDELLDLISKYDYFVLCGDMNPSSKNNGIAINNFFPQYLIDYMKYVAKGYVLANCGNFGIFNTIVDKENSGLYPWDNIIVSSNINIINVVRNNVVLSDHYPLTAVLEIIPVSHA